MACPDWIEWSGLGDAVLNRVAGSPTGGGPFLSSGSIYFGNFAQIPNALGGTLRITDSTPLADLKTVVFQIQIGEATGYDLYSAPALKINGGSSIVDPLFSGIINRFQNGTFNSPATGADEPVYVNTRGTSGMLAPWEPSPPLRSISAE